MTVANLSEAEARAHLPPEIVARLLPEKEHPDAQNSDENLAAYRASVTKNRAGGRPSAKGPVLLHAAEDLLREGLHGVWNSHVANLAAAVAAERERGNHGEK